MSRNTSGVFFLNSSNASFDRRRPTNIDSLNDETFGSGAVEENWENEHNQFAEQHSRSGSAGVFGRIDKTLDDDELELSNQQLAAAVEELVLNSDHDQDSIDPAIVSLRRESRPGSYDPRLTEDLISPYMGEQNNFGRTTPTFSSQNSTSSSVFQTDGMRNIWSNTDREVHDSFAKSPSMIIEREILNDKLRGMMSKMKTSPEFEDEAILSAVKAKPPSSQGTHWPIGTHADNLLRQVFPHNPVILRAEDLEREFSVGQLRGPSPTFGISIPKENAQDLNSHDRSLPARSISPIIGSPTSHALPIGTPPKHITDMMMQQAYKQGFGGPHPNFPAHFQRPPHGFMINQVGPPRLWPPPGMMNRPPMNPLVAQDIMNRIGGNKLYPMMTGPHANMSPIGSPRFVRAPNMIPRPNIGFGPQVVRPGQVPHDFRGPMPQSHQFQNQQFGGPPQRPVYLGPGHLHPEHSRFVRMRRQQSTRNQPYNNQSRGNHHNGRMHISRDPHSCLMTNREKEWVIKIQMLALQSDRPEIDDYYYQHYIDKRLREGRLSFDNGSSEQKRLITPTKTNPENKKYIPVQFNNSLGKLTVSSAYNPRQIIDIIHSEKEEETATETGEAQMGMNKRLEIYKIIEKCYSTFLEYEELNFNPDKFEKDQSEHEKKMTERAKEHTKVLEELLFPSNDSQKGISNTDIISQLCRIRKGKRLLCRVLPIISKNFAYKITLTVLKQLMSMIKRDQKEEILHEFYFPVCQVLNELASEKLLEVFLTLTSTCSNICKDKFGFSILCKILIIGDNHVEIKEKPPNEKKKWNEFVSSCLNAMLSLGGKMKTVVSSLLENELAIGMVSVLDHQNKLVVDKHEKKLLEFKELLLFRSEGTNLEEDDDL